MRRLRHRSLLRRPAARWMPGAFGRSHAGLHLRSMQRIRPTVPDVGKFQSLETQGRMTVEGKLAQVARHVTEGRLIVARQCALISKQKQGGFGTFDSERLLEQFERSLAIFEDHLQKI